jgi:hypothetical protein
VTAEEIVSMLAKFEPDEKEIVATIVQRIDRGRREYGPWEIDKDHDRDYRREAFEELVDTAIYSSAELVRMDHESNSRIAKVYVCHAWSNDPVVNSKEIAFICKGIVEQGALPIAPQLYLPAFMDEATQREQALAFCLELLADCDLVLCFGTPSEGMRRELAFARSRGIKVRHMDSQEQLS